ncbi:MAG TPA: uroporphyrinogen-III synthase [Ilumatobacter sp.]
MSPVAERPLTGRRVVTTRERRGRLDSLLARLGADVVHLPLIAVDDPPDGGAALARELDRLGDFDWLVVTSQHGARRAGAAAARVPALRTAAVGTTTAAVLGELAGRAPTVVPAQQNAVGLLAAMPAADAAGRRVLVVQADRAADTVAGGLRRLGYEVTAVVGYVTTLRTPSSAERAAALAADAVAFASGSAALAWIEAFGTDTPPVTVAIGPATRDAAAAAGLPVTHTAADHGLDGLVDAIVSALRR